MQKLAGETRLEIVPGATHLFAEPDALEQVATLAADWFTRYLPTPGKSASRWMTTYVAGGNDSHHMNLKEARWYSS